MHVNLETNWMKPICLLALLFCGATNLSAQQFSAGEFIYFFKNHRNDSNAIRKELAKRGFRHVKNVIDFNALGNYHLYQLKEKDKLSAIRYYLRDGYCADVSYSINQPGIIDRWRAVLADYGFTTCLASGYSKNLYHIVRFRQGNIVVDLAEDFNKQDENRNTLYVHYNDQDKLKENNSCFELCEAPTTGLLINLASKMNDTAYVVAVMRSMGFEHLLSYDTPLGSAFPQTYVYKGHIFSASYQEGIEEICLFNQAGVQFFCYETSNQSIYEKWEHELLQASFRKLNIDTDNNEQHFKWSNLHAMIMEGKYNDGSKYRTLFFINYY